MKIKNVLLAGVVGFSMASASTALAHDKYGLAGCGLGSMVIENKTGMSAQTAAATTNGTSASQTFGITSGTSNCTAEGVILASKEQEAFFEANFASIQKDMASGGGEHLAAFTGMLGCADATQPAVFATAQESFGQVFPTDQTTPTQALYMLKLQLSQKREIASTCAAL